MIEKKKKDEIQKNIEHEQLNMWSDENNVFFKKEKETNERVNILTIIL